MQIAFLLLATFLLLLKDDEFFVLWTQLLENGAPMMKLNMKTCCKFLKVWFKVFVWHENFNLLDKFEVIIKELRQLDWLLLCCGLGFFTWLEEFQMLRTLYRVGESPEPKRVQLLHRSCWGTRHRRNLGFHGLSPPRDSTQLFDNIQKKGIYKDYFKFERTTANIPVSGKLYFWILIFLFETTLVMMCSCGVFW